MQTPDRTLLPSGFSDQLPPDARRQRQLLNHLLDCFGEYHYEEVSPPLIEFESSLLGGSNPGLDTLTFRLLDPVSHQMMGLRADMTLQVARIARSRLADRPFPLRLSYGGPCCLVTGSGLRKERQILQAGLEIIGSDTPESDLEILRVLTDALQRIGTPSLSLDITLPQLPELLLLDVPSEQKDACREALRQKDRSAIINLNLPQQEALIGLIKLSGTMPNKALWQAAIANLSEKPRMVLSQWLDRVEALHKALPQVDLTLDPLEDHGYAYHRGLAFSLFSREWQEEIGRGGRYVLEGDIPAIGATLYLNPLLRGLAKTGEKK